MFQQSGPAVRDNSGKNYLSYITDDDIVGVFNQQQASQQLRQGRQNGDYGLNSVQLQNGNYLVYRVASEGGYNDKVRNQYDQNHQYNQGMYRQQSLKQSNIQNALNMYNSGASKQQPKEYRRQKDMAQNYQDRMSGQQPRNNMPQYGTQAWNQRYNDNYQQ